MTKRFLFIAASCDTKARQSGFAANKRQNCTRKTIDFNGNGYSLIISNARFVTEWLEIIFNFRDSDAFILAGLDDVQSLLDDHILKSQSMRGSPFIAALGKRATDWEEKLINMQDIMDVWLKVQSTWMYLEVLRIHRMTIYIYMLKWICLFKPIFNSEDIMRQMPVEGRNFKAVCTMKHGIWHIRYN